MTETPEVLFIPDAQLAEIETLKRGGWPGLLELPETPETMRDFRRAQREILKRDDGA